MYSAPMNEKTTGFIALEPVRSLICDEDGGVKRGELTIVAAGRKTGKSLIQEVLLDMPCAPFDDVVAEARKRCETKTNN